MTRNGNKDQEILFTTLGMLVLDEIHFASRGSEAAKVMVDVVGGSGAWCTSLVPFLLPLLPPHS